MKRIGIYYFSGTDNTKIIAKTLLDTISNQNMNTRNKIYEGKIIPINEKTIIDINTYDMIGILFPINAHATSPFIWKFLQKLPKVINKPIFVIYTYNDSASIGKPLQNMLNKKGYIIKGLTGIKMPNCRLRLQNSTCTMKQSHCHDTTEPPWLYWGFAPNPILTRRQEPLIMAQPIG